jgi:RimJ/RimL family protein N-acetyltransferase
VQGRDFSPSIHLEPWGPDDLPLLEQTVGDAEMMRYLGGPESPEKMAERQERFAHREPGMHKIVDDESGRAIGSVGFWEKEWNGEAVHEVGWFVIPEFQGRGIAVEAMKLLIPLTGSRPIHAFPNVENAPSNAICRKLGFRRLGEMEFEYPPGHWMTCADWRLEPTRESPSSA